MLIASVAALNILLGLVYTGYGTMTLVDMHRNRSMGFSHFGMAWVAMAFTCGPHHWAHGIHVLEGSGAGLLDLIVVAVGFPAGATWFLLRVEAFRGGRGDRFVAGNPAWVVALPTLAGAYVTAVLAVMIANGAGAANWTVNALASLLLVGLYSAIGYYLIRTQLANRKPLGGWSLSGLALAIVMPTCAVMHGVYGYYLVTGAYANDTHMAVIDWIAVPAAIYFLWVVQALYRGAFHDWNGAPRAAEAPSGGASPPPAPAPAGAV